jgi:hypothetical protein
MLSLRERASGAYTSSAYFAAKSAVDMIIQVPCIFLFICPAYWLIGFQVRFFLILINFLYSEILIFLFYWRECFLCILGILGCSFVFL